MKCFNCSNTALYHVNDPEASEVYYCSLCLPVHLKTRADNGDFDFAVEAPAPAPTSSKKSAPADPAPTE
jgi:hypothetical protein